MNMMKLFAALILPLLTLTLSAASDNLVRIPHIDRPVPIDGVPVGGIWDRAAEIGNPVYLNAGTITPLLTMQTRVMWDDEALYVGFAIRQFREPQCVTPAGDPGDSGLERDDAVEVTLFIPGFSDLRHHGEVAQFKLNCQGQRDDGIHFDFTWNAEWEGATHSDGNEWSATFRIPFHNFGVTPQVGDRWGANFCAYLTGYNYRAFLWSPVQAGHQHYGDWGVLEFGPASTPAHAIGEISQNADVVSVSGRCENTPGAAVRLLLLPARKEERTSSPRDGFLVTDFDTEKEKPLLQEIAHPDADGAWHIALRGIPAGDYRLKIILQDTAGNPLNIDVKPLVVEQPVEVRFLPYPVRGSADLQVRVNALDAAGTIAEKVAVNVRSGGREILRAEYPWEGKRLQINLGQLENNRRYDVEVAARKGDIEVVRRESWELTERPVWADTQAGILPPGAVPSPWEPLQYRDGMLSGTGKEILFDNRLLPGAMHSNGFSIVRAPITLEAAAGKRSESLGKADEFQAAADPARYTFTARGTGALCVAESEVTVDFDGFTTVRLGVQPLEPLNRISVRIPLGAGADRFIKPLPGATNRDESGMIPPGEIGLDPQNEIWLASPDAGFYFGLESTRHWIAAPGNAARITATTSGRELILNFYDSPEASAEKREYLFFLQPAPVRPYPRDRWDQGLLVNNLTWGHNCIPLEDDVVRRIPLSTPERGSLTARLHNYNDLAAIACVDLDHWGADEHILAIGDAIELMYSQHDRAIVLKTPWGMLTGPQPCDWQPDGDHTVEISWGDALRLRLDGTELGSLEVAGLGGGEPVLALGSISARYRLDGLEINGESQLEQPLELRSSPRDILRDLKEMGAGTLIFFEHWSTAQNGGWSRYEPVLKNIVEDVHRAGLKVIFYFGFEIADVPEHRDMIVECKALADQSPNFYAPARQNTWFASYGGPYREYLLYNMERLKRELGIDGVYLDAALALSAADNPAFGAGYTDAEGVRHTTVPVRRIREFAQRIHQLFIPDGGVVFAHQPMSPPTVGYLTSVYLGEHLGFLNLPWESVEELIPRDVAIHLYAGKNTGVPMVLCIQNMWPHLRAVRPRWYQRASAWANLNRVGINVLLESPMYRDGVTELQQARVFREFGADRAEWLPYWELSDRLAPSVAGILGSAYRNDRGEALLSLYNGNAVDASGVALDLRPLLDPVGKTACDIVSGREWEIRDSTLHVDLPGYEGMTLWIRPRQ